LFRPRQVLQASDEEGGRGRPLPPQIGQLFGQLADGIDAVIEVKNNSIIITGPEVIQPLFLASASCPVLWLQTDRLGYSLLYEPNWRNIFRAAEISD